MSSRQRRSQGLLETDNQDALERSAHAPPVDLVPKPTDPCKGGRLALANPGTSRPCTVVTGAGPRDGTGFRRGGFGLTTGYRILSGRDPPRQPAQSVIAFGCLREGHGSQRQAAGGRLWKAGISRLRL